MELFSEHLKKEHILSKIDARVKIAFTLAVLGMTLSCKSIIFPVLVLGMSLMLCLKMKVPLRVFLLRFSGPLFIAFIILFLKLFFSGKDVFFSISLPTSHFSLFTLTGYRDGLLDGLFIAGRILGAVSIVAVLGFSTSFTDIMAGLSWFRVPKGFIEILMFAYRYIFVLLEDAMVIYNAQKNRLGYSSIKRGLSSFGTLAGSLIIKAFDHSQNITVAMVQRGYDGNIHMLKHKPFKLSEIIISVLVITAMGFVWKI
ncbi:MAG TPA: cobalt ECF transporter T component CbiQ [Nitrospiraceae bacterium]|nr:cobalt ECF transporter T component CbiQ [Nitrospiraceae bacterium]